MDLPSPDNSYLCDHAELLISSFHRLTQRHLIDHGLTGKQRYQALFQAPFAVVSHNTSEDPIFNYANETALKLFEMPWEVFTQLPSRKSAEPINREERRRLLAQVNQDGYFDDYKGVRISANGQRFRIEQATIWNLIDESDSYRGQAAVIYKWTML